MGDEAVADASYCPHIVRGIPQLLAQALNMRVDGAGRFECLRTLHFPEQRLASLNTPAALIQQHQQPEFECGE